MKDLTDVIMNPVRQRISQYLILNKTGTVNEIANELSDVPRPSIYRHVKRLLDAELIEVVEEKQIRGVVEKTYSLVHPKTDEFTNSDIALLIQHSLMSIAGNFAQYFKNEKADPVKDMLSVSTSTLLLSDAELMEFFGKIGNVYNEVIQNKPR
ncbi:MAG: helix-turn-helix domain-containing protein [Methanocorpusculum sp.]|nr:helix-turn-helix domain-containing protein [Methanocorpusculum sp.]